MAAHYSTGLDPDKVLAHRLAEATSGWPMLRACPSTFVTTQLAFLDSLAPEERIEFVRQLSAFEAVEATGCFATIADREQRLAAYPLAQSVLTQQAPTAPRNRQIGVIPVKVLAGVRRDTTVGGIEGWAKSVGMTADGLRPPPALAQSLDEVIPVAPRELRKLVKTMMKECFGAKAAKFSAEDDHYAIELDGLQCLAAISFARSGGYSSQQLDYYVRVPRLTPPTLCYEMIWRTCGRWDWLTPANAPTCIAHLGRLIKIMLSMLNR